MSEERRDYAVLISLATREEAEVAAGALRADGVDAFVANAHHAHLEWGLVPALGGLQIMVPTTSLGEARANLQARLGDSVAADEDEPAVRRDRYKAWLALGWLCFGFLMFGANVLDRALLDETAQYRISQAEMRRSLLQMCAEGFANPDDRLVELCRSVTGR